MVEKLIQYPEMKFMFAEMSFFNLWWNEIDETKKATVKRLANLMVFRVLKIYIMYVYL